METRASQDLKKNPKPLSFITGYSSHNFMILIFYEMLKNTEVLKGVLTSKSKAFLINAGGLE